jgi:hypothetical protein
VRGIKLIKNWLESGREGANPISAQLKIIL